MKQKQRRKNDTRIKMLLMEGSLYKAHTKTGENDLQELQVNNYEYNEGTINFV